LTSALRGFFGKQIVEFDGVAALEQVKPYIEKDMRESYESRKKAGKA
jgi:hypothetical protein